MRQGAKIEVVGVEILDRPAPRPLDLDFAQGGFDGTHHARGDFVLKIEDILHAAVELVSP